jgi:hypothetical protein
MTEFKKLALNQHDFMHLYIPSVPNHLTTTPAQNPFGVTCSELANLLENQLGLGHISWIEFNTVTDHHGNAIGRQAHVKFACWYDSEEAKIVRNDIKIKGSHLCRGYRDGERFVKLTDGEYISLCAHFLSEKHSDENVEALHRRIAELEQGHENMRQDYDMALDKEIQRNAKLVIARQEQSRKIIELLDRVQLRDAEIAALIAALNSLTKEIHKQGHEVICAKEGEVPF